jgi:YtkA-like
MSRALWYRMVIGGAASICFADIAAGANVRAKADVACQPAPGVLQYDCVIKLVNARTGEQLTGVTLMVGADMPSMPMMHNVRPVKATPGQESGTYKVRIVLEMHGDWALQLDLSGPLRDRVVTIIHFVPERATPAAAPKAQPRHKH